MIFRQYQLGCLSLFSYLVGDEVTKRAVVVDPQRDVSQYLADAAAEGLRIERVLETHFHADFLSGHLELADATGAVISYGPGAQTDFPMEPVADGQRLSLGDVELEVLATPGHTPESISIVVYERAGSAPWGVLTGDTLFIGDVGRPDLVSSLGCTSDELARQLYRSLHDQLLRLPDETRVFPAHGAGSSCGRNMSAASESTIGEQRRTNYALQPMGEDAFVAAVTEGQPIAPLYFAFAADANRHAHELLDDHRSPQLLDAVALEKATAEGAVVIDGRAPEVFASGHVRGSINVPLDGRYAEFAGDVVRAGRPIVVVTDAGRETEATVRLARIGFDNVLGAVDVEQLLVERPDLGATANRLPVSELAAWREAVSDLQLIDVRNPAEHEAGAIDGSVSVPLPQLLNRMDDLRPDRPTIVYCAAGTRSSTAASVLRAAGFSTVADVLGGYGAWQASFTA
jgi:glyoxylase-like metal-dependent hydrolase (beta-lactamase superfamily II)